MEKAIVKVCLGTTCHLMGSSHLQTLEQDLPEHLATRTTVKWSRCLGLCKDDNYGKAPYVIVGDKVISEATIFKIVDALEAVLN
ncbi:NAD(P)H-dependent oxidoreductase subunit E [Chitinispirillales bacterium ANBcel5]|uniref:NAD(P)H-dependent oxidoreductase subunit E n=1 Tax=Cellulosispirillum alkaliphilum TaxID=3039283 RepID=UPI002A5560DC|nr:NAD(P)H-dependent oxidoreductase subunit E [Chitinispirillales bacterium ANBcel5]